MGLNAGGVDTVDYLYYPSGVPVASGQMIKTGVAPSEVFYLVVSAGGLSGGTGVQELNVRQVTNTGLAAATQINLSDVTGIVNSPTELGAITIA